MTDKASVPNPGSAAESLIGHTHSLTEANVALRQGQVSARRLLVICIEKDNLEVSRNLCHVLTEPNVVPAVFCEGSMLL